MSFSLDDCAVYEDESSSLDEIVRLVSFVSDMCKSNKHEGRRIYTVSVYKHSLPGYIPWRCTKMLCRSCADKLRQKLRNRNLLGFVTMGDLVSVF